MTDIDAITTAWKQHKKALSKANTIRKKAVFDALANAGITVVNVDFDGEGDSGQINNVAAYANDQLVQIPAITVATQQVKWNTAEPVAVETSLSEAIEELCYDCLSQEQEGWENDGGAYGEFTYHVPERRIELDFNARFTDYTNYQYSF